MKKKILAILLACVMVVSIATPMNVMSSANTSPCRANLAVADALQILRHVVGLSAPDLNNCLAFERGYPNFEISDALQILREVVGLSANYNKTCPGGPHCPDDASNQSTSPTTAPTTPWTTPTTIATTPWTTDTTPWTTPTSTDTTPSSISLPTWTETTPPTSTDTTPTGTDTSSTPPTSTDTTTPTGTDTSSTPPTSTDTTTPTGTDTSSTPPTSTDTTTPTVTDTTPSTTPSTPSTPNTPQLPAGVLFDMQTYPALAGLNAGNISFLRRVGNNDGFEMVVNAASDPKTVTASGRTGTSQGIRVFAAEIAAVARVGHSYEIKFTGRFPDSPSGEARIREENPTGNTLATSAAVNGEFSVSAVRTHAEIVADGAAAREYSLGNSSGNITIIYTGITITRICPDGCTACIVHGVTIVNGGSNASVSPASPVAGEEVTVRAGSRAGQIFDGWEITAGGVTLANAALSNTTFTMPAAAVTLTATWKVDDGSGGIPASLTAHEVVARMGLGWNLGNQFDAGFSGRSYSNPFGTTDFANTSVVNLETNWAGGASFRVERALINNVKAAGFDTIRIPVTWYKAIEGTSANRHQTNFTIRRDWMDRVKEVVDWAYEAGFYVILNSHHDDFIMPFSTAAEATASNATLARLWTVIAGEFNEYGERLIFEVLNEPRIVSGPGEWVGGGPRGNAEAIERRQRINDLNQAAVNAIRATGGNNANRILMIPTHGAAPHAASWGDAFDGFTKPNDPANPNVNKMILSIHSYQPEEWSGVAGVNGAWVESTITNMMNGVQTNAARLGMPVVLGEWGSVARGEPGSANEGDNGIGSRGHHHRVYVQHATSRGMATVMWDTGMRGAVNTNEGRFGIFYRNAPHNLAYTTLPGFMKAGFDAAGGLAANVLGAQHTMQSNPLTGLTTTPTNTTLGVSQWSLEMALAA